MTIANKFTISDDLYNSNFTDPVARVFLIRLAPKPINKLNKGPAIEPAKPILPKPAFARELFNVKSGRELPRLKRVIPRKKPGTSKSTPIKSKTSIRILATNQIQNIDITKAIKAIRVLHLGVRFLYVYLQLITEIIINISKTPKE